MPFHWHLLSQEATRPMQQGSSQRQFEVFLARWSVGVQEPRHLMSRLSALPGEALSKGRKNAWTDLSLLHLSKQVSLVPQGRKEDLHLACMYGPRISRILLEVAKLGSHQLSACSTRSKQLTPVQNTNRAWSCVHRARQLPTQVGVGGKIDDSSQCHFSPGHQIL